MLCCVVLQGRGRMINVLCNATLPRPAVFITSIEEKKSNPHPPAPCPQSPATASTAAAPQ